MNDKELLLMVRGRLKTIEMLTLFDELSPQEVATSTLTVLNNPDDYDLVLGWCNIKKRDNQRG